MKAFFILVLVQIEILFSDEAKKRTDAEFICNK